MNFDESKHPRDGNGKFTEGSIYNSQDTVGNILRGAEKVLKKQETVTVELDTDIQRKFDQATKKERQKIAFRYLMDNLRGKYAAQDGREIYIEKVGADKLSHTLLEPKIRVLPELARLIETGIFIGIVEAKKEAGKPHKLFKSFAYYQVHFQINDELYNGLLNVGIRENGSSTLYDLNPFEKQ